MYSLIGVVCVFGAGGMVEKGRRGHRHGERVGGYTPKTDEATAATWGKFSCECACRGHPDASLPSWLDAANVLWLLSFLFLNLIIETNVLQYTLQFGVCAPVFLSIASEALAVDCSFNDQRQQAMGVTTGELRNLAAVCS